MYTLHAALENNCTFERMQRALCMPCEHALSAACCRGKGVGSMLMRWAEQTSESIMLREVPTLAGVDKCRMLLRVSREVAPQSLSSLHTLSDSTQAIM